MEEKVVATFDMNCSTSKSTFQTCFSSSKNSFNTGMSTPIYIDKSEKDHSKLQNRDLPNQHPIDSISGLAEALGTISSKIRCASTAQWEVEPSYIPEAGQIIVYTDYKTIEGTTYSGVKIGDGMAYIVDLPFLGDDVNIALANHINDIAIHVSAQDREFWNNKVTTDVNGDNLILTKL